MVGTVRSLFRDMLGERVLGAVDYWRSPHARESWGGPFNGQAMRQALFLALIARLAPRAILETGTYRASTTEFMAATGLPIFSIEGFPRNYGFARARLFRQPGVRLFLGDSRSVMRTLLQGSLRQFLDGRLLAYLDAHGETDLPLAEELDLLFAHCPAAIAMIDDFEVPFDSGYGFDDYGPGRALIYQYVEPAVTRYELAVYYPSTPASRETGMQRGCIVLAKASIYQQLLASEPLLRVRNP